MIAFKLQQTYSTNIKSVFAELALTNVAAQQASANGGRKKKIIIYEH